MDSLPLVLRTQHSAGNDNAVLVEAITLFFKPSLNIGPPLLPLVLRTQHSVGNDNAVLVEAIPLFFKPSLNIGPPLLPLVLPAQYSAGNDKKGRTRIVPHDDAAGGAGIILSDI